jgi:flagellar basal body L-ring protein FlgH
MSILRRTLEVLLLGAVIGCSANDPCYVPVSMKNLEEYDGKHVSVTGIPEQENKEIAISDDSKYKLILPSDNSDGYRTFYSAFKKAREIGDSITVIGTFKKDGQGTSKAKPTGDDVLFSVMAKIDRTYYPLKKPWFFVSPSKGF